MTADSAGITETARLDLPPPEGARVILPPDFGPRFIIFADAEEEFDWNTPFQRDATATTAIAALPGANQFFTSRGCTPTYLVDWPVVANADSARVVREMVATGACDVGAQLHPWVTPPFDEMVSARNSYTGNLPVPLQGAKLVALTERITEATGARPIVYRAGRYGVGPHTAGLLAECGYRLDVSVRSGFDYRSEGGPDFSSHPSWPWRVGGGLNALPMTTARTGLLRSYPGLYRLELLRGPLARLGLLDRVPLTPEGVPLADALSAIARLNEDGHQLFSLSFHTPSLVPGHTPYVRDSADLRTFWAWWDGVFGAFAKAGIAPMRSSELIDLLDQA